MKILRKTMPFLASVLLFVSCNKEAGQVEQIDDPSSDFGKKEVVFGFSTAEMGNPQAGTPAKTAVTRAGEPAIETDLKNVRVLQFDGKNADSKLVFNEYYSGDQVVDEAGTKKLYVSIFEQETSCIYVIANAGENQLKSLGLGTKLSDFEAMTLKFASENDVTSTDSALPMVGKSEESTASSSSISVELTRMVAKVAFECKVDIPASIKESFKITRVQVLNAASGVCFNAPAVPTGTTGLYPDGSLSDNFFDYSEVSVTEASVSKTWYLPENLRGVVAGLTEKTKGGDKVPAHSTCIEVSGDYTETVDGKESLQDVTYRIYLGGNASDNFNLIRNNSYTVTVTIKGKNVNDVRVTVEKGIPAGSYGDAEWPADEAGA